MNASDILAFYMVDVTTILSIIAKIVFPPVLTLVVKTVLEQAIKRYSNRKRSQLNQFYSDVSVFQEILQETKTRVIGTGDNYARQLLEKNLDKCQKVCNQIENQSLAGTFLSSSQQVEELDLLLRNSIHMTNTYLSAYSAGMKADLRHLRAVVNNLQAGMCQLQVREALTKPNQVTKLTVEELKPGILHVSWKETMAVDYYEVQYDRQTGHSIKVTPTQCLLDSMQLHFPSEKFYNVHVRGVNGCGPGEWSESAVGKFTILPEQPRKPLAVHVNSSTIIALVMEKPLERDGAKPVTHFVIEYHTDEDKTCTKKVFPINKLEALTFEGKEAVTINLNDRHVNTALTYHVLISHRNEDGDSLPCEDCIETATPDAPEGLKVAFQNSRGILIEWRNTNAFTVDYYEVHWEYDKDTVSTEETKNCYVVEQFLDSNTIYLIKVRAVNRRSQKREFTEIRTKTESNAIKLIASMTVTTLLYAFVQHYMPVIKFSVPVVAMIAIFFFTCTSTKYTGIMHYLIAPVITANIIIAAILDSWHPMELFYPFFGQVQISLTNYIAFIHMYCEDIQLVHYMLEKHIVSLQAKEQVKKQAMQENLFTLFLIFECILISFVSFQCYNYFIPMSYRYIKSAIIRLWY